MHIRNKIHKRPSGICTVSTKQLVSSSIKNQTLLISDSCRDPDEEVLEKQIGQSTVPQLTALGRSLSSIEIAPLWAEMVDVVWPRDPLQRVETEDGLRLKLEWKMLWSDDKHFTRVNCVACNPQDRVKEIR